MHFRGSGSRSEKQIRATAGRRGYGKLSAATGDARRIFDSSGTGASRHRQGEDTQAIPLLRKAATTAPKEYRPHFLLGSAYNHPDRYKEAAAEFETALQLGSHHAEVYYQLARAYGKLDRMTIAVKRSRANSK